MLSNTLQKWPWIWKNKSVSVMLIVLYSHPETASQPSTTLVFTKARRNFNWDVQYHSKTAMLHTGGKKKATTGGASLQGTVPTKYSV